jgi:ribonuclease P protein component
LQAHCDYVLIGRRAALSRGFDTMLQDFETALTRLDRQLMKRTTATPQAAG